MADRVRRSFAPVVLLGLTAGALASVALQRVWARLTDIGEQGQPIVAAAAMGESSVLTALGMLVAAVVGMRSASQGLRDDLSELGVPDPAVSTTAWPWVYLGAAVASVAATALAVRLTPGWPEMGNRYDAPRSAHPEAGPDATGLDLWRALDEGRDPTLPERRPTDP